MGIVVQVGTTYGQRRGGAVGFGCGFERAEKTWRVSSHPFQCTITGTYTVAGTNDGLEACKTRCCEADRACDSFNWYVGKANKNCQTLICGHVNPLGEIGYPQQGWVKFSVDGL